MTHIMKVFSFSTGFGTKLASVGTHYFSSLAHHNCLSQLAYFSYPAISGAFFLVIDYPDHFLRYLFKKQNY